MQEQQQSPLASFITFILQSPPASFIFQSIQENNAQELARLVESNVLRNAQQECILVPDAALHLAAQRGYFDCLSLLLPAADVNEYLYHSGYDKTPLHVAAQGGHSKCLSLLLQAGANVNAKEEGWDGHDDFDGYFDRTALHFAAQGHCECLSLLLQAGADVNALADGYSDCRGTALHFAAYGGHDKCVSLLLQAGADVNPTLNTSNYGLTALHLAAQNGHNKCVSLLLQAGANINALDDFYGTALRMSAEGGHFETVALLLQAGADVDTTPNDDVYGEGTTALHLAAEGGYSDCVGLLLQAGANANAKTKRGLTPSICALRGRFISCYISLRFYGAQLESECLSILEKVECLEYLEWDGAVHFSLLPIEKQKTIKAFLFVAQHLLEYGREYLVPQILHFLFEQWIFEE